MSTTPDDANRTFLEDALRTLAATPRSVPSKYLYDERGSQLFEQICTLDEYYLTRTEAAILRERAGEFAERMGEGCMLIEYGSGSSTKTRILLDRAPGLAAYVPIDISRTFLLQSAEALRVRYPALDVRPVCADYMADYELPKLDPPESHCVVWFPGSTIGNLTPAEAKGFLCHVAALVGHGGGLLIGVDLHKDTQTLEAAYDDAQGVSAEFALNVLDRMNRELGADFRRERFGYHAAYDERAQRIEMAIVSLAAQQVRIDGRAFAFEAGERIRTEYSYKYTLDGFAELAHAGGLEVERVWTDAEALFSVQYLVVA